jgi:hypothetical protein
MSRIEALNQRYADSAGLIKSGVEILAVADAPGARFDAALRRLVGLMGVEGGGYVEELLGASKALRWCLVTQPQPADLNPTLRQRSQEVSQQAHRLRGAVRDEGLIDELAAAAEELATWDSLVGTELLRSVQEVGGDSSLVVAASGPAASGLSAWLADEGVSVVTMGELEREASGCEQAYAVGAPRFFRPSLFTAPVTREVSFLVPSWFGDRSLPRSPLAPYAEGAIRVPTRHFNIGEVSPVDPEASAAALDEADLLPHPSWGATQGSDREPGADEVKARKVLLCGNLAIWLDDGDRIRSLDPAQPPGERVTYTDVAAVRPGTVLLLRQGVTERGALYDSAVERLPQGGQIAATQAAWKSELANRIRDRGNRRVVEDLRSLGVKAADQARAWTDPNLIRPHYDRDFETLLTWLGMPIQPAFGYASILRKSLYHVSAEIGRQLEDAVSLTDLSPLDSAGYLSLDINGDGFRGLLATRVLAMSPFAEVIQRHDARVPFEDNGGQWLE